MDNDNKPIDDVSRPGSTPPDSSSKPIVVSNSPTVRDDTVVEPTENQDQILQGGSSKVIEPIDDNLNQEEPVTETVVQQQVVERTVETREKSSGSSGSGSSRQRDASQKSSKSSDSESKQQEVDSLVESKKYYVKVDEPKKKRTKKFVAIILTIFVAIFGVLLAADAGYINLPFDLPFDLIKNNDESQPVEQQQQQDSKTDENSSSNQQTESVVPEGFTSFSSSEYGFSFAYPSDWGKLSETDKGQALYATSTPLYQNSQSEVQGSLYVYVYSPDKFATVLSKYGPLLEFSSEKWVVKNPNVDTNEANSKYIVGDIVNVPSTTSGSVKIYDLSYGDEGCQATRWVYRSGVNFVEMILPSLCGQDLAPAKQENVVKYEATNKQIQSTIKVNNSN